MEERAADERHAPRRISKAVLCALPFNDFLKTKFWIFPDSKQKSDEGKKFADVEYVFLLFQIFLPHGLPELLDRLLFFLRDAVLGNIRTVFRAEAGGVKRTAAAFRITFKLRFPIGQISGLGSNTINRAETVIFRITAAEVNEQNVEKVIIEVLPSEDEDDEEEEE